MRKFGVEE